MRVALGRSSPGSAHAAAIVSAIENALGPFGVRFAETPLTPERIVDALAEAGAYRRTVNGR